ncbi:MAG: septum site-determining protein Ssd [Mycolicibacterium sp.]|uniref:septum site-determining protein Ssd n=1 Tax=Mycolicibacterium sp. TaxID=2320850 RepID=UPI003D0A6402
MTPPPRILAVIDDPSLSSDIDRVVAAAGLQIVRTDDPSGHRVWSGAAAIVLDLPSARRCAQRDLPRRGQVILVSSVEPGPAEWEAAIAAGAQKVMTLPANDGELMVALAEAADMSAASGDCPARGAIAAVLAGRGGAGASVFATALARVAGESLLIDGDPWGGGLDLVLGTETEPGLRWPDLSSSSGRLNYSALREALPRHGGVSLLSGGRVLSGDPPDTDISPLSLAAVIDAGSRGGATVVCDVARQRTSTTETALAASDLVVLVTTADVRSCAASVAVSRWASQGNPNTALLVRGPSPGGLRPSDVGRLLKLPVLAAMRPERGIRPGLERGGLGLRRRSPLAHAAVKVLEVLRQGSRHGHSEKSAP